MSVTKKICIVIISLIAISGLREGHWLGVAIFIGIAYLLMKPREQSTTNHSMVNETDDSVDLDNAGMKGGVRYSSDENNLIYDPEHQE